MNDDEFKLKCPFCKEKIVYNFTNEMDYAQDEGQKKFNCPICEKEIIIHFKLEIIPSKYDILCCLMCADREYCTAHCGKHGDIDCFPEDLQNCLDQICFNYKEGK